MLIPVVLTGSAAHAASLDLLEVGGAYGTPAATNPTALWWNPAGLTVDTGHFQFLVDIAPTIAAVDAARTNPDYGTIELSDSQKAAGFPQSYDYSGTDRLTFNGVVPFIGVESDFTVKGLGVGLGLAVPTARGGSSDQEWGANRYALRDGNINAIHLILGAGYRYKEKIAAGASLHLVSSSWFANTDTSLYPDLAKQIEANAPLPSYYQDPYLEQRQYTTTVILGGETAGGGHGALHDTAVTFGAGVYYTPVEEVAIALSYNHGVSLDHTGDLTMKFQCPPTYDTLGNLGATARGLCNTTLQGTGEVSYRLPDRLNLGVVVRPTEIVRLEAMGSWVFWSAFSDYQITTTVAPDQFPGQLEEAAQASADLVSQNRQWARDTKNTFWIGLDGKVAIPGPLVAGARVMYDHHGIPDEAVSANNIDFNSLITEAMFEVDFIRQLGIGVSWSHHFLFEREITNSEYALTIDEANAKPDRLFYPSANGTYSGAINRIGVFVRGRFGGPDL